MSIPNGTSFLAVGWTSDTIDGVEVQGTVTMHGCPTSSGGGLGTSVESGWCEHPPVGEQTAHYDFVGTLVGRVCVIAASGHPKDLPFCA